VEAWAQAWATPAWLFAAARVHAHWAIGTEVTEAQYTSAVESVAGIHLR